jgi:hypothetical protein
MLVDNSAETMAAKDDRPRISSLGEWYEDLLRVDSAINGRSEPVQAASLLCAKLQERESIIRKRLRYLASKRNMTSEEMWLQILKGEYQKLSQQEINELRSIAPIDDETE